MHAGHGTVTHLRNDADTENATMKPHTFTSSCLLLLLAAPAWGQSPPQSAGREAHRPLNLSLPRDVLGQPSMVIRKDADETATRNLRQEGGTQEKYAERPRYGTGYEARQRGMAPESNPGYGVGGSAGMGAGAGTGGSGRGGMGRGR